MEDSFSAIIPPIITIIIAISTKEIYLALFLGIFSGALLAARGNLLHALSIIAITMDHNIGNNIMILILLITLGSIMSLIKKSGAITAYSFWGQKKINSKKKAKCLTIALGLLIFIDDFFNALTTGTIMQPISDSLLISRVKMAYIIDTVATATRIIIPISSWAAAIALSFPNEFHTNGFAILVNSLPFNLYAILSLLFLAFIVSSGRDFSKMRTAIINNKTSFNNSITEQDVNSQLGTRGKIIDLILPLTFLIIVSFLGILFAGGFFDGVELYKAFLESDAINGLVIGAFLSLLFTVSFFVLRGILGFREFCDCFVSGAQSMIPAILVLCFAWTLSGICDKEYLNLGGFVSSFDFSNSSLSIFFPFTFFIIAFGISFATGTSWGTFGILIPIAAVSIPSTPEDYNFLVLCVSAILSGSTGGSHASPISDTTIITSMSTKCRPLDHVSTQLPYCLTVSGCSAVGYLIDGITKNGWVGLIISLLILSIIILFIRLKFSPVDV